MDDKQKEQLATKAATKWATKNLSHFKKYSFDPKLEMLTDFAKDFVKELDIKKKTY